MDFPSLQFLGTGSVPAYQSDLRDTWPHQWTRGSLMADGGVLEDLPGRLYLLGWVQRCWGLTRGG